MTSLTLPKQYKLLVMGNPLLDIQVVGDEELLKRFESCSLIGNLGNLEEKLNEILISFVDTT